jgi:D-sedoheptulose 7-phosphate isomerase
MKKKTKSMINEFIERYPALTDLAVDIERAINIMKKTYYNGGILYICGNGGSAADSEHMVGELMKSFVIKRDLTTDLKRKIREIYLQDSDIFIKNLEMPIPAMSLVSQSSLITAFSNDKSPDLVFAQQILGYGKPSDTLVAISTSGNSTNVVNAAKMAKILNMSIIAMTGNSENDLNKIADLTIKAPEDKTYRVQEYHLPIYHTMCRCLEFEIFG